MAIQKATLLAQITIEVNILTSPLPENGLVLELVLESVLCPIIHIAIIEVHLAGDDNIDMLQEGQVKRRSNVVYVVQNDGAAVVAFLERLIDRMSIVSGGITPWLNEASPLGVSRRRVWERTSGVERCCL